MKLFAKEEILPQHFILSYKIDLYFPKHKLAIEVDEKEHKDIKKCDEDEHLYSTFIRINPEGKDYYEYVECSKIINHIKESNEKLTKESTKKSLIDKISK